MEAVEVDGGDGDGGAVVRRAFAEEAFVIAYVRADPCGGYVERVGGYEVLEVLNNGVDCC